MAINKKKIGKFIIFSSTILGTAFVVTSIFAKKKKAISVFENEPEQKNPLEGKKVIFVEDENDKENADGVRGHLEAVSDSDYKETIYTKYVKRGMDIILSFGALVVLSPVLGAIALAIKIEDPGPVFFTQKRMGQNKQYFRIHKFRSMKMNTPHDVPTHMLEDPEQYITKVGKFIRTHSLDELPQLWDIFVGNMSVIGPRPGLWNQDVLTAERDKYGANDVKPGLTGWSQINGRDELDISKKAKLDGEYVSKIGFLMDLKVFFGSLHVFGKDDSIVEGGTGKIKKNKQECIIPKDTKVSVVMATFRRDEALRNALNSLVDQTYDNFEVVLIDDNDNVEWSAKVLKIVESVKDKISINYIVNELNLGSAEARNKGIFAAEGQYITFLDDDDIYLPEKIEMQLRDMIESDSDYGITDLLLYDENDKLIDRRIRSYIKKVDANNLMKYHLMYHMTGTDTFMFKSEYLKKIGGFPSVDVGDEFYLMKESILAKGKFTYSPHCYIKAYVHTGEFGGLSSGQKKIDGENALFLEKKKYFNMLDQRTIQYINARHYAVLAFAELRRKSYLSCMKNIGKAVLISPKECIEIIKSHILS